MENKQLHYFLEICRVQSFSKAAQSLFISQQGLSKSIRALEEELQTTLFIRRSTGIALTHSAELLRERAAALLQHHSQILREIRAQGDEAQTLTIGYAAGCFDVMPPGFLTDYMALYPDVNVCLKSFDSDRYSEAVLNFRMDISLCPVRFDGNLFDMLLSFRRKVRAVMADTHALAQKKRLHLRDFAGMKTGFLNTFQDPGASISSLFQRYAARPSILLMPTEMTLLGELASRGGIAFFYAGRMEMLPGNLVLRDVEGLDEHWEYYFLANKNAYISQSARDFIDFARLRLGQDAEMELMG